MPCLFLIIVLAMPRLAIVLLFLFTNFFSRAYDSLVFVFLGFIFLPLTTVAYAWAINVHHTLDGLYLIVVVVAVLVDLGLIGSGEAARRRQG